jgi:1,4-dihydroxy-2-naphthoate octaprenyltransferase
MSIRSWISACRPQTLLLALATVLTGSAAAVMNGGFRMPVFLLAAATAMLLQILSNLANDYGDFVSGKDNAGRIGPRRMVQTGKISAKQMLAAIIVAGALSFVCGAVLVFIGAGNDFLKILFFGLLGVCAIAAAVKYTAGKKPYGYRGLGDISVFIFFGPVGAVGTYFLHTLTFAPDVLLPASSVGLLSVGVLNMNNMRDFETDSKSGKRTLTVMLGEQKAKFYHFFLIASAIAFSICFTLLNYKTPLQWLFLACLPLLAANVYKTFTYRANAELYSELPRVSLAAFLFAAGFMTGALCGL